MNTSSPDNTRTLRIFLIRGVIAIAWAVVFLAVSSSLPTGVTVGAGVLLVLYPLIDAVATLIDARSQHGSARRLLLVNAACSIVAAIALTISLGWIATLTVLTLDCFKTRDRDLHGSHAGPLRRR